MAHIAAAWQPQATFSRLELEAAEARTQATQGAAVNGANSAFGRVLDRLHNVQANGNTAKAGCPLCQSRKGRPVVVRDTGDGRVLLHGFCGHGTDQILGAVGLSMADLFDAPRGEHKPMPRSPWNARDVLELALIEVHVVGIVASDIATKRTVSQTDWQRLSQASGRLIAMASEVTR